MTRDHPFANTPLAQHPFRIGQYGVPIGLGHNSRVACRNHRIESYNHVLALTSPSPRAKEHQWGFALRALWVFLLSHSWAAIRDSSPAAFARDVFRTRFRSLPTLVYSIGGVTDAGDGYRLSAFSNAGAARAGTERLTKESSQPRYPFSCRPSVVTGTLVISALGTVGLTLSAVSLSAFSPVFVVAFDCGQPLNARTKASLVGASSSSPCPQDLPASKRL
jgi:hypothetical protein